MKKNQAFSPDQPKTSFSSGQSTDLSVKDLIPVFSKQDISDIILYYKINQEFSEAYSEQALEELKTHPVWGPILMQMTKEMIEENNKMSQKLQEDAIIRGIWEPYIKNLIEQGIQYAKIGVNFKDWVEIVFLARRYFYLIIEKEFKDNIDVIKASGRGMNLLIDNALNIIGESYLTEERKKVEQTTLAYMEEKRSSQYTRSLIEASLDPFVMINPKGKITDVNEAWVSITGVAREKLIGSKFSAYFTESEKANEAYKLVFENGSVSNFSLTIRNSSGKVTDVLYNASVYKDEQGNVLGAFAAAHDITVQKQLAELEQLKTLEQKRKEYTHILEMKNKQLVDFCNIVSHNLRAPLMNVVMLVDYIEQNNDEQERKEVFGKIKPVINHLSEVFDELVESVQIRQDTDIKSEKVNLNQVLSYVLKGFETQIQAYGAQIHVDFREIEEIHYPKKYLNSILTNLISNALKYKSPDRKPVIHIRSSKKANGKMVLSVADNGLGIDLKMHKQHLFKIRKVFHKHPEAKGFGLFLIKTQVDAMGGKISLKSTPNVGSTFFVEFINQKI